MTAMYPQYAANALDPVRYATGQTVAGRPATLEADAIEKVDAGAALVYALYHRDPEWWRDQPLSVCRAYQRAFAAYGIGTGA